MKKVTDEKDSNEFNSEKSNISEDLNSRIDKFINNQKQKKSSAFVALIVIAMLAVIGSTFVTASNLPWFLGGTGGNVEEGTDNTTDNTDDSCEEDENGNMDLGEHELRVTTFGGSDDTGVTPTETGSVTGENLRGLDPSSDCYTAFPMTGNARDMGIWVEAQTNMGEFNKKLKDKKMKITNPANGKSVEARIVDRGPKANNTLDTSDKCLEELGINDGDTQNLGLELTPN
jgi:hypothetical protein